MLRNFGNTTLLVAALFSVASFGTLGVSRATAGEPTPIEAEQSLTEHAQPLEECPIASDGVAQAGVGGRGLGCLQRDYVLNCRPRYYGQPELFYDYYAPGTCGGVPAGMYPAPYRVPPVVGETYYTYQPFMPHELLYQHRRAYYRYYNGGRGMTRTSISWYRPPLTGWYSNLRIAR